MIVLFSIRKKAAPERARFLDVLKDVQIDGFLTFSILRDLLYKLWTLFTFHIGQQDQKSSSDTFR